MKTGIYGGTFNPIHLGHMQAAAFAAKELGLEQLVLIVIQVILQLFIITALRLQEGPLELFIRDLMAALKLI